MQYKIFGCKTNKYYTEKWLNTGFLEKKTGFFVASCVVTDQAKSKWIKFIIDKIKEFTNPDEKIYLSGCGSIEKGILKSDFFTVYNELEPYKDRIILLGEDPQKEGFINNIAEFKKRHLTTRKYVVIQSGCDNHCTFCTTIQARGQHRSRDINEILDEFMVLDKSGIKEVVITGINIGAWGCDNTRNFKDSKLDILIRQILTHTNIPRLRISSLGIEYLSDNLIELFGNKRIYPHLHLSIQSGSTKVLKLMNRNYSKEILEDKLSKIRLLKRDDNVLMSIGADFIVGFPQEDEMDFEDTLNIIKQFSITKLHAFPFSIHKKHHKIPASYIDGQISDIIKKDRMKKIIEIGNIVRDDFIAKNIGKPLNLLIEKIDSEGNFSGWSENYIALNKNNFFVYGGQDIKIGNIVKGELRM